MQLLSFQTLPLKEQELVENQCMSCSPIKSSVNVTRGSPGRKKGLPGAQGTRHLWGPWRTLCCCREHVPPKAQEARATWKALVVVFSGMVLISLVFLFGFCCCLPAGGIASTEARRAFLWGSSSRDAVKTLKKKIHVQVDEQDRLRPGGGKSRSFLPLPVCVANLLK